MCDDGDSAYPSCVRKQVPVCVCEFALTRTQAHGEDDVVDVVVRHIFLNESTF